MEPKVTENHPGQTRLETAEAKAERILQEELASRRWTQKDLETRQKSDPTKLALAARLRQETTLSVTQIAERLHLGKPKGARANLDKFMNPPQTDSPQIQLNPTGFLMNDDNRGTLLRTDPPARNSSVGRPAREDQGD